MRLLRRGSSAVDQEDAPYGVACATGDASVIGFDDDISAAVADLTTVHQNPVQIGREAAHKALALMNGQTLDEPFTTMPTSLVLRSTTERVAVH